MLAAGVAHGTSLVRARAAAMRLTMSASLWRSTWKAMIGLPKARRSRT
jgi:hypothetical protein